MGKWLFGALFSAILIVAGCGSDKSGAPSGDSGKKDPEAANKNDGAYPDKTGTVVGRIVYKGTPPVAAKLKVNKDNNVCGSEQVHESLTVDPKNSGIKWAVVAVQGLSTTNPAAREKTLDQKGCRFEPHVLVIEAGDKVNILNSDGVLHNIHTFSANNPSFNEAQPKFKKQITKQFYSESEPIKIKCDVHSWMSGWIVVVENPYYSVTNENGEFRIENVPVGRQVLEVWHETLGTALVEVEVKEGAETKVETLELVLKSSEPSGDKPAKKKGTMVAKPIYDANCSACHGSSGKGDGPAAAGMPNKPANLTASSTQNKTDADLEKIIREGRPEKSMPPWKHLPKRAIKDLVSYLRFLAGR